MSKSHKNLIEDLVADLKPVARPGRIGWPVALWLTLAIVYSVTMLLVTGPLRPGAFENLTSYPFFALETIVALATIFAFGRATYVLAIPGRSTLRRALGWPLVLLGIWCSFYIAGLWWPAHPVSTLGQRDHCVLQGFLFSLPSLFLSLVIVRRLFPVWPRLNAAVAGAAAATIPAALMQFGCMYVPSHILLEHIGPILPVALTGAIAGPLVLNTRKDVPRSRGEPVH